MFLPSLSVFKTLIKSAKLKHMAILAATTLLLVAEEGNLMSYMLLPLHSSH